MSESTRALEGPRRLTKEIPAYEGIYDAALVYPEAGGWENGGQANLIYYETYFDLSANTLDDLTFVTTGVVLQDPGRYISTNDDLNIEVVDINGLPVTSASVDGNMVQPGNDINAITFNEIGSTGDYNYGFTYIMSGTHRLDINVTSGLEYGKAFEYIYVGDYNFSIVPTGADEYDQGDPG